MAKIFTGLGFRFMYEKLNYANFRHMARHANFNDK